jgi:hypothetical protein
MRVPARAFSFPATEPSSAWVSPRQTSLCINPFCASALEDVYSSCELEGNPGHISVALAELSGAVEHFEKVWGRVSASECGCVTIRGAGL